MKYGALLYYNLNIATKDFQCYTDVLNIEFRIILPGFQSQSLTRSATLDMKLNLPETQLPYLLNGKNTHLFFLGSN